MKSNSRHSFLGYIKMAPKRLFRLEKSKGRKMTCRFENLTLVIFFLKIKTRQVIQKWSVLVEFSGLILY